MAKFDYKKWVTENKRGLLNEQTYQQILVPGTTYRLRGCDEMTGMMSCLPDSFFGGSPVPVGHTFTLGFPPQPGNQGGIKNVYVQEVVAPCQWYVPSPNAPLNAYPVNIPTEAQIAPGPLDSCPNNPNAIISDPVDEDFVCYGCHPTLNQIATTITAFSSADENGVCGTINFSSPGEDPSIVTFYDDVNHPQLENCGAEGSFGTTGNYEVFDYPPEFNPSDWTANFIDMIINHPNPCNFLAQRIGQFYTAMGNQISFDINGNIANPQDLIVGPLQANMLMQKLVVCVELYNMFCLGTNLQEQSGNIGQIVQTAKNIKMDPKVRGIVRKAITRLRDKMSKPLGKK